MVARLEQHQASYIVVVPAAIAALWVAKAAGIDIPNQPGVLLLAVAYCAYRGGVVVGLGGAAFHVLNTAIFFSQPGHLFTYSADNAIRAVVIAMVAPAMGLMVGYLRREADQRLAREQASEAALVKLNAELEERVLTRTAELLQARNMAEEARAHARVSEERFRDFATTASDWFWEQDENLRFSYFSPEAFNGSHETALRHLGKTRREVGTALLTNAEWNAHEAELAARRPFRNLVTKRQAADGSARYTSTSGQPFFDEDGQFRGYRGTARDVTADMLAEIELERRVTERTAEVHALQQKVVQQERRATLDQLTATVSHELRNPLSAIRNSLYVIAQTARMGNLAIERPVDRINRSIQRCESIIAQLVEYSQIRSLKRRSVALDKWLADVLDEQTLPASITLERAFGAGGEIVSCDADHLHRVVFALIENAVQAIERAETDQPSGRAHRVTVTSRLSGDRAEIEVADNGPGIAPQVLQRIFEPLFSTKAFGIGLGLALARQILDYHGGGIDVVNAPGQGVRAILWLPRAAAAEAAA
jgi:PAS domain S-box-containing protein